MADEREKFEAWARDLGCDLTRHPENWETYADHDMWMMWCGWRAGAASVDRGAAQPDLPSSIAEDIGSVRRSLFLEVNDPWNGVVRDITARLEVHGKVNREAVLLALTRHLRNKALAQSFTQPDLEAIALKYFPPAIVQPVEQGTMTAAILHSIIAGQDLHKPSRLQCLAAMREALQLPSREKEQKS
jgi:hypothetical protein